ncbi:MAG: acetylxylan esterase [Planctomycetaceae bacterium]|nr:acetylxylan esterase [Planctomycetaceae bacterium]
MPQPDTDLSKQFLTFVQQRAIAMRSADEPPASLDEWKTQRATLRQQLIRSWGGFPKERCPLEPRILGELKRDGYRLEKVVLQTRPGVLMTANAYVPDGEGRQSAVLCVHGHWSGAKQDPVVQARCIGLAKLGFFVLSVDAFGAGERGLGMALGEYHGEMVAATLWPTGLALAGLQVYENMRAVDYLQSRPEVDPDRIGITGTSGGGNQTMYAGAIDERIKCVVPACSVGTYQSYLGVACCMCEVTPAALSYTEESGVLALVAPRGLMLINATRDSFQFSVGEAKKSLAAATQVFRLYGKAEDARHAVFESNHDYNQPMREAMYGWMTLHLNGEGDGSPIPEPEHQTEDRETIRCFPGESRPDDFITIPRFAATVGREILKHRPAPDHAEQWHADAMLMRESLPQVLGGRTARLDLDVRAGEDGEFTFSPELGISAIAQRLSATADRRGTALVLDLAEGRKAGESELATELRKSGWDVVVADLRATGAIAVPGDLIRRAPDHNSAEWSMWIGRPLLGQWVWDAMRTLDAIATSNDRLRGEVSIVGVGPASLIALSAAALDSRFTSVVTVNGLASFVSDVPYENQWLGTIVPGFLRDIGDVPQIASLVSPRPLIIAGGVTGGGQSLSKDALESSYAWTTAAYRLDKPPAEPRILADGSANAICNAL